MATSKFSSYFILTGMIYMVSSSSPCELAAQPSGLKRIWDRPSKELLPMDRPLLQETVPTTVSVSLGIHDINVFNTEKMDVEYDLLMTQRWYDHRLAPDYQTKRWAVMGAVWMPKVTFTVGSICANSNDLTQFWRGTTNGSVLLSERFSVKSKCTKDLRKYPFDTQRCLLKLGSYRFTTEEVNLVWDTTPVELHTGYDLVEFLLMGINTYDEVDIRSAGNFSVLVVEFVISRYSEQKIATAFAPSIILVSISYIVFWFDSSAIRPRMFLCKFSLAGIICLHVTANSDVSNVGYFKAIDIWFAMCTGYVLLSFVESIVVDSLNAEGDFDSEAGVAIEYQTKMGRKRYAAWIDKTFRLLHPTGFAFCAILYCLLFVRN